MSRNKLVPMRVVFRCDGSREIGFGHVSRCLTLAEGFQRHGVTDLRFVLRDLDRGVIARIEAAGHPCDVLPERIDESEDALITTVCTARKVGHSLLVTDSHAFSKIYYEMLRAPGMFVLSFDDYAGVAYASDLVVNHNITAAKFTYTVAPHTRLLLGTKYFPLRRSFRDLSVKARRVRKKVESVVVALGGMPEIGTTTKILDGLHAWARACEVKVRVVLGVEAGAEAIRQVQPHLPPLGELLVNPADFPLLLWNADIAIVNGSLIAYEAASIGTPLIMTAVADNQVEAAAGFNQHRIAMTLPASRDLVPEAVTYAIVALSEDAGLRKELAKAGRSLVDGSGTERIVMRTAALASEMPGIAGKGE